jgi:predicted lipid-binding transport protein (Tim44 family)
VLPLLLLGLLPAIYLLLTKSQSAGGGGGELDFVFDEGQVAARADRTQKLLEFLARDDPALEPAALARRAEDLFPRLQKCWQERSYESLQDDLMPPLFAEQVEQLEALRRNHEINRLEFLQVEHVAIVHVLHPRKRDGQEFTALITAKSRDYYVDDRTNAFLRGDEVPVRFQEFWTFQRQGDRWRLRDIEQARDSDALREENEVVTLSAEQLQEVYAGTSAPGPAGPWADPRAAVKETRVERLLNFLAQRDPLWDRARMIGAARRTFLDVMFAQEQGTPEAVPDDELFEPVAEDLKTQIRRRRDAGTTIEFRNLCIRKVELILVRNYRNDEDDEFTVRIRAHAQKIVRSGDQVTSQDRDVRPFEQYWTFGRSGDAWKLKEVLPPVRGQTMVGEENVDEESTREQLEWYYTQTQA